MRPRIVSGIERAEMREREIWLPVPGYVGHYEVSNFGLVASVKKGRKVLAPLRQLSGHLGVGLCLNGVKTRHRIHSLVMLAFVGPRPEGYQVRHLDGDPENNELQNLAYGTGSENRSDAYVHGGRHSGERSHLSKISDAKIAELKALKGVVSGREAASMFNLTAKYVRDVWRGKARKHDGSEAQIEKALCAAVRLRGGEVRKLKWDGRQGAPDRLVMLPDRLIFVELKRPGGAATFPKNAHERKQLREHERMRKMGQRVVVIDSIEGVEELLK